MALKYIVDAFSCNPLLDPISGGLFICNQAAAPLRFRQVSFQNTSKISLKPGIYRFSGSVSLLALSVFMCHRKRGYGGHLDFIIFYKSFLFSVGCLET